MPSSRKLHSEGVSTAPRRHREFSATPLYNAAQIRAIYQEIDFVSERGAHWRGACSLHGGTRPNFVVEVRTARFFCHSKCAFGGTAIGYLHRLHGGDGSPRGADYWRAQKELQRRLGDGSAPSPPVPSVAVAGRAEPQLVEGARPEADAFWKSCQPVTSVDHVSQWLETRHIDAEAVASLDLARVVPEDVRLPTWAGSWPPRGYIVAFPLYDSGGHMVAARFRLPGSCEPNLPKSVSPKGIRGSGMVMAGPTALKVLRSGSKPGWWANGDPERPFRVVIAEGEPDFLSWSVEPARHGLGYNALQFPAVLGVASGSLTPELIDRVPYGTELISAFDNDQGGDRHHAHLVRVAAKRLRDGELTLVRKQYP
jgi:hypothetical protein